MAPQQPDRGGAKLDVVDVSKVFGKRPQLALDLARQGHTKDEILAETGQVLALRDVSFSVDEGEIFIVMGLSGSGKSTLVRCLNRLVVADKGHVYLDGEDIVRLTPEQLRSVRRHKLGMVFQHFALLPHKTVLENVAYGLKVQDIPKDEARRRALDILSLVGLDGWDERSTRDLSGGMKQRVGLARALAIDPDVLLMDEPFSALDPLIRSDMRDQLLELQRRMRKTIVFITHDLDEALLLGDRISVMRDGRVVQIGTPQEIVTRPADDYVARFVQDVDRGRFLRVESVMRPATTIACDGGHLAEFARDTSEPEDVFLVDAEEHPVGVVTGADVERAARDGVVHPGALSSTNFARVSMDATLDGAYAACGSGQPVAVLDKAQRLVGALDHLDVMRVLGGEDARSVAGRRPADSARPLTPGALS